MIVVWQEIFTPATRPSDLLKLCPCDGRQAGGKVNRSTCSPFQKKHKMRTKWPEFADLILKREKYILEWKVEWIQDQDILPSKLAVIYLHFLGHLLGNWNLLVLSRAMSFSLVVWLKSSWRNISVTWNFLGNDIVNLSWDKRNEGLLGIFEVVLVVHPKEQSQLWGFLNFASPVFEAMGGSEEYVASDLQ